MTDTAISPLRRHMRSGGVSATSMKAAVSALRFFFGVTLGRDDAQVEMTTVADTTDAANDNEARTLAHPCPCCGGRMIIIETFERGAQPRQAADNP